MFRPMVLILGGMLACTPVLRAGKEAVKDPVEAAVVGKLRQACIDEPSLRGTLVKSSVGAGGLLKVRLIVDKDEQRGLLKKEATRLLASEPTWGKQFAKGI